MNNCVVKNFQLGLSVAEISPTTCSRLSRQAETKNENVLSKAVVRKINFMTKAMPMDKSSS